MSLDKQYLHGMVDMGSNGIRFSISDLSPKTARILPTVFSDRCGVSLYDAQYSSGVRGPIPQDVIAEVIKALTRFKVICEDFGVPACNVRVVATEATRTAPNSKEYRESLQRATGWVVEMLPKEDEGKIGAMGIASSFTSVEGIVMDLGGGSTQLSWMIAEGGEVQMSQLGAVSFPYGAAALMRQLEENMGQKRQELQDLMVNQLSGALKDLQVPESLLKRASQAGGLKLYLSGGGFRGWGYILMANHPIKPYPIPIINGFECPIAAFGPASVSTSNIDNSIFGISSRRVCQLPAISFLVDAVLKALPPVRSVLFSQGGVREGVHFNDLTRDQKAMSPLVAATSSYGSASSGEFAQLLRSGIPSNTDAAGALIPAFLHGDAFIIAVANTLNRHSAVSKDVQSSAALRTGTTGLLASAHGVSHEDRALLSLALCKRWGNDIASTDTLFRSTLRELVGEQNCWWAEYIGVLAQAIGNTYPATIIRESRLEWESSLIVKEKKGEDAKVAINMTVKMKPGADTSWIDDMEKLGKKSYWGKQVGNPDHWRLKASIEAETSM
jgi:retrograde regulation protein 2